MKTKILKLSAIALASVTFSILSANAATTAPTCNNAVTSTCGLGILTNNDNTLSFVPPAAPSAPVVTTSKAKVVNINTDLVKTLNVGPNPYAGIWYNDASGSPIYVYNHAGTKIGIGGEFEAGIAQETGSRTQLTNEGTKFGIQASQLLNAKYGIHAIFDGSVHVGSDGDTNSWNGDLATDKLYAGFNGNDLGQLTFGSQDTIGDYTDLASFAENYSGISSMNAYSKDTVVYFSPSIDGFSFGANYTFGNQDYGTSTNQEGYGLLAQYNGKINKNTSFALQAAVGGIYNQSYSSASDAYNAYVNSDSETTSGHQISTVESATITYKDLTLGGAYSYIKASKDHVLNLEGDIDGYTLYQAASEGYYSDATKLNGYELGANYQYNKLGNS
ncbi:MAG: porin, partial [Psittacicella sp.]